MSRGGRFGGRSRLLALSAILMLSGCVASGTRRPAYVPSSADRPGAASAPGRRESAAARVLEAALSKATLRVEDLLLIADHRNPEIAAARAQIGVSAGRLWQAELYPNPTVSFGAENIPTRNTSLGRSENTVSITQPIILGGRRRAAIDAADDERLRDILRLDDVRRQVLGEVRATVLQLVFVDEAQRIEDDLIRLAQQTHAIATDRFSEGAAPESESLRSRVELERLRLSRRIRTQECDRAAARLRTLIGDLELPPGRIDGRLPAVSGELDLRTLLRSVERDHPRITAAEHNLDAAVHRIEVAEAARIPDLGVRMAYGHNGELGGDIFEAGIELEIPLFNRNQGRIVEARHQAIRARQDLIRVRRALSEQVTAAHARFIEAQDRARTFSNTIVPAAEKALSQTRDGYQAGRQGLIEILDAQRTLSRARLGRIEALRGLGTAEAELIGLLGPLQRENRR